MSAGCTPLDPSDVQRGGSEIHLLPPQVHQLRSAQAVPVGNQHYRGVAVPPTVLPSRMYEPLDLGFGQVLAGPQLAVRFALRGNWSIYGGWRDQPEVTFGHGL